MAFELPPTCNNGATRTQQGHEFIPAASSGAAGPLPPFRLSSSVLSSMRRNLPLPFNLPSNQIHDPTSLVSAALSIVNGDDVDDLFILSRAQKKNAQNNMPRQ